MNEVLLKYLDKFRKLKRGNTKYGPAPHKPILLISVLQAFSYKLIAENRIYITPELVKLFNLNWTSLVTTNNECKFTLPFFHLQGEKFWHIIPKQGFELFLRMQESVSSFAQLNAAVEYTMFDEELYLLVKDEKNNKILQQFLLDEYFPETKNNITYQVGEQGKLFDDIEGKILNENPEDYKNEIKKLLIEQNEEEVFIRGSVFKREIPKIYNNTCCISGMRIDATINISMIDACHIVPFSESYDDTITNGIALCPNLHRAFDRGLISIDENYKVVISKTFREDEKNYSIKIFEGKGIQLPKQESYYPMMKNLEWHKENIYKV